MNEVSHVEIVDVDELRSIMLRHYMWAKTYWHIWEHLEHAWEQDVGYTLHAMDQNIERGSALRRSRRDGR